MSSAVASYENYDDDGIDDHPNGQTFPAKKDKQAVVGNVDEEAEGDEEGEDEDEDDEDDEEDDEEDEDDEEEDENERPKKKAKGRKKRNMLSRFVDVEAEVDDDDEDVDDDEEEYAKEGRDFIAAEDDTVDDNVVMRAADHHRFREDRSDVVDAHQIARDLRDRYRKTAARYTGDSSDVPQRLLMPGVSDASLWQVRVRPGKEKELIISLMRKSIDLQYSSRPLEIGSAFWRDSLPGMIYVEARSQAQVNFAISGLVGVFLSRGVTLVPIDEMASLLRIKKNVVTLTPGSWVRIKRGKYTGDLAQVIDVTDNGEEAGLRFIPRIDLTPREDFGDSKKRKKSSSAPLAFRPPQKFFIAEEVSKVYKNKVNLKPGHSRKFVFQGDTYNNGYIEKDIKISGLIIDNVNPTLDEITRFTQGDRDADGGGGENAVDLSIIAEAARKAATVVLQPGDHVEVFEGEQTGMHGIVESIQGEVLTLRARHVDIEGQKIEVPAASVRKKFKAGDHVKVMAGKNADETGLVVSILNDTITFLSDMSLQEVTVFAKDVREAAEVGAGTNAIGNYELHDLVQLDQQTIGVIYKTERDSFRVIDQNGQTRLVQPHQITMRKDSRRAIATDAQGHEIRISDNMKEIDGEQRKGQVLHIHQSHFAFLYNRELAENGGVFVTRARGLQSVAPKGTVARPGVPDLSKMNPAAMSGGMVGSGMMGKGHRDKLVGINIVVVKGPFKGYLGTIKDTNGAFARVELHTQNKVITIEKEKLRRKHPHTGAIEALESGSFNMPPPRSAPGGATPGGNWGGSSASSGSRTPFGRTSNPYSSQTPAWGGAGSQTPHHSSDGFGGRTPAAGGFGDGGRTPASGGWGASSRTPNPYAANSKTPNPYAANDGGRTPAHTSTGADGRTPAWGAPPPGPGSRTPALGGGAGVGGRTPAGAGRGGFGGATPNPYANRNANLGGRSGATPSGAGASSAGGWGIPEDAAGGWGAASAPTPGPLSAPTPGMFSLDDWSANVTTPYAGAPTPYVGAPTPGAGHNYAQTPGMYAQTPGMHYAQTPGISAATPGAALSAPTPGAHHSSFADLSLSHPPESEAPWVLGCSNVWVTIVPRDDLDETHFAGGVYDGRNVVVLNVMDMNSSGNYHASTATVRFIDEAEKGTSRSIPIDYLDPVLPKVAKEKIMVFKGPFRHQVFEIQSISADGIWASPLDGGDPLILDLNHVVKWQDWNSAIL